MHASLSQLLELNTLRNLIQYELDLVVHHHQWLELEPQVDTSNTISQIDYCAGLGRRLVILSLSFSLVSPCNHFVHWLKLLPQASA